VLHGGLTREERRTALERFARGGDMVLLATDAAGEGLNLHRACRLVVNLELPWNPMRLEQRIGRIDRIGQERTVHAFHLIAADTAETRILSRLKARIARAQADIGAPDPIGAAEDHAIARLAILGVDDDGPAREATVDATTRITPALETEAAAEATRLTWVRALVRGCDTESAMRWDDDGPWSLRARRSAMRAALGCRVVLVWKLGTEDASGRTVEARLVPVAVDVMPALRIRNRGQIEDLLRRIDADVQALIGAATSDWRRAVELTTGAFLSARVARGHRILADLHATGPLLYQAGLFDRRAERLNRLSSAVHESLRRDEAARVAAFEREATLEVTSPRLALVLAP
jgi:hypothetical protein